MAVTFTTQSEPILGHDRCLEMLSVAQAKIRNLETALVTARQIGTAVGIVMAHCRVTDDMAFHLLALSSQKTGRELRAIAQEVIDTGDLPGWD